jgi:mannose-6-phosphate isomerase-like protein (cupin superfamily)
MRDAIAAHTHTEGDELLYVIAGEGSVRLGDEAVALKASSLVLVPRGLSHQLERRGKNPLIVMSTLTGEPCPDSATSK